MTRLRSISAMGVVCAFGMAALGDVSMHAAASPPPTVSITRNTALNGVVWPGDFNQDGITDLVSSTATTFSGGVAGGSLIQVSLGKGDGTFAAPVKTTMRGTVIGVGDFNEDGRLDVVVQSAPDGTPTATIAIMPGNGDGTLGAAVAVDRVLDVTFGRIADIDGNGHLDILVATNNGSSYIYPGNGDLTFGSPVSIVTGEEPLGAAIADLNGDGTKDLVVADADGFSISIFLNHGALTFTAADMPLDRHANDVVARDLNGDGKVDLVVATASVEASEIPSYRDGFAYILFGNGDGTFAQPIKYEVARGAWRVVLGDFTRDGVLDIATANRSSIYRDDDCGGLKTWDSVSILPGNGDGTFAAPSSFSLGNQANVTDDRYRNTVASLNTSDLNGDHATDLIASWGAIVFNQKVDPNWAPTVTASATQPVGSFVTISASANDVDQDMLTYSWTDSGGLPIPPIPRYCFDTDTFGVHTYTVTVDDHHGHTASSSVTVDFGSGSGTPPSVTVTAPASGEVVPAGTPYTIRWTATAGSTPIDHFVVEYTVDDGEHYAFVPGCSNVPATARSCQWNDPDPPTEKARIFLIAQAGPNSGPSGGTTTDPFSIRSGTSGLPAGWQSADIGAVNPAGSATYNNGVFTVKGSGADIWGTADAFHYVSTVIDATHLTTEPYEITARVTSVQNVDVWTKAGLMIRTSDSPSAAHASLFVTPGKGIAFQRRDTDGAASVNTGGGMTVLPIWLKLVVGPNSVRAYIRTGDSAWISIGQDTTCCAFGARTEIGLAVTSHHAGTLATATFDNVSVRQRSAHTDLPIGGGAGHVTDENGVVFGIQNNGVDIWGNADDARALVPELSDNGVSANLSHDGVAARVLSVDNANPWTKAGVMMRENWADAGSRHVTLVVTPGKGVAMQYRATTHGVSAQVVDVPGVAPKWVRLRRDTNTFIGETSDDGIAWHEVGRITLSLAASTSGGLVLTSHDINRPANARFDDIVLTNLGHEYGVY